MELKLQRPIIFFDLETTGVSITADRIVEIACIKVMPDGTTINHSRRVNPGMHIPEAATAVHGITDADVANEPLFSAIAEKLARFFAGCDIAGFNSTRFDVPMLDEEMQRAGIRLDFSDVRFVDVQNIFHKKEKRTLEAAYRFYCDKELAEKAHTANGDTEATYEVLKAQLDRYPDLGQDVESLADFSAMNRNVDFMGRLIYDEQGREVVNFGKHKGKLLEDVLRTEPGYYDWVVKGDFSHNTKDAFRAVYNRVKGHNHKS